jgi:serine phosphatase RsbU (regulator of sigma subunit)/DNA-binding response OmpR family regulator
MKYKPKILIVDDRRENLYTLENVLKGIDAEVIKADNGNDALIATLNNEFALAILDVQMPGMDGYELAELMRGEAETKYLPIIFLSAVFSDDFHIFKGYDAGAVDFITKPFNPDVLLAKVRIFLELYNQRISLEKHQRELLKSNALMSSVMESPRNIGIFALDRDYRYISFNQNHKEMMKRLYDADIKIGMRKLDIITNEEEREKTKLNFDSALRGEAFVLIEVNDECTSGENFCRYYRENHYNPIVVGNDIIGLTVFLTDITKSKQIEEDLKDTNEKLREQIAERRRAEEELVKNKEKAEREREIAEVANKKIMDSIRYAHLIQSSLLPNPENIKGFLPDSFFIWMPRDIVGGDFIFTDYVEDGFVIAVIDCTGHGVPGAFMTMIASFGLRKIIGAEGFRDPAKILKRLNFIVKTTLQQDTAYALSDDGLDAAVCFISESSGTLTFAGAKLPLIYIQKGKIAIVKGDKHSIGYKRSELNHNFSNHEIKIEKGMCFYMLSDGFIDQLGGENRRRFGSWRFKDLLKSNYMESFEKQREIMIRTFAEFKGKNERQDDVTVVGFGFR